ncbi:CBM96 family carbohydrate-binding protein [Methanosarcina mazei]|nr:DNRLRE domain-containing protein [Methanosarcina mazei]
MFKAKHLIILCIITLFFIYPCNAQYIDLAPTEDSNTYSNYATTNYGNSPYLETKYNEKSTYLKFYVPTYVSSAKLNLYCTEATGNAYVYATSPDWNESGVTWNNPPSVEYPTRLSEIPMPTTNTWYTIDVSSVVSEPGYYSFELKSQYASRHTYNSSEALANTPYLKTEPSPYTDIIFNNKTNDTNRTFLVNTDDCIRFSITPPDSENITTYQWQLNKTDQPATSSYFDFIVPAYDERQPSTGIWEIWVNATYTNGTSIYREWLISSLPDSEAPDYIEYFSDLNNTFRHGFAADPWGRYPPFYTTSNNYISKGFLTGSSSSSGTTMLIDNNFDITYGTFKFKIRNPGCVDVVYFKVLGEYGNWNYVPDGNGFHDYYAILNGEISEKSYIPISRRWIGQAPSMHFWRTDDAQWKEITLIHTCDDWWSAWDNGVQIPGNYQHFADAFSNAITLTMTANNLLEMDCIEVYKDKYLYPNSRISYGSYPKWWCVANPSDGFLNPVEENGIIAFGQNLTLESISDSINNDSLMTYDTVTNTAIIKTNLFIEAGGKLNITDETLLFDTSTNSLDINLMIHSTFNVENSTISTIGNNPIRWNLASAATVSVFNPNITKSETDRTSSLYYERKNSIYDFGGRFIIQNSMINNTCNLFLDGASEIVLNNVVFSNHSSSDYGDYTLRGSYYGHNNAKNQSKGEKALWIVPRNDLANFMINNISFVNPKSDIDLKVVGGEWIFNSTTVKNCDLSGVDISTKKAYKMVYFVHYWNLTEHSDFSLLNCKFNESKLNVETNHSKLETKYYADIVVKDASGNLIRNAVITPNASNEEYEAENLHKWDWYISDGYGPGQGGASDYAPGYYDENGTLVGNIQNITYSGGSYVRWYNAQPLISATTNTDGRTSLPSENVNNSVVLTDYVLTNETGKISKESIEYDFAIRSPDSKSVYLQGVNPDPTWYRQNPSLSTYTITAIIPDNSTGPHITGFAPAKENPFNSGEKKNFRIWTDEPLTSMEWRVNGSSVLKGSLNYTWTVTDRNTTIEFIGSNSNGTVNHIWPLGESPDEPSVPDDNPAQEIQFSPSDSEITLNVSEKTLFSVSPDVFTTKEWYINGYPIQNNTTSMTRCWSTAGTHDVTFKGAGSEEPVSHTWTVNVVEEKKNDEESTESIIAIAPEYQIVKPKQSFGLDITVDPSAPIIGTQLDFEFNSSMASANSVIEGDLFKQKGASTFFNEGDINSSEGIIKHIYGLIIGTSNVSSPGTFATVNLTAGNRTGMAEFSLSNVLISDINSKSVPYTVTNATVLIDTAPAIDPVCCPKSVDEKSNLAFKISAKDADGDRLTLSASGLPEGSSFNRTSGAFAWTPAVGQAGVYTITFKVSDGYLTDSENVTVTVNKLNNPPVINFFEPINGSSFSEGERIGISVNATDAEKQALNYSIKIDGVMYSSDLAYVWETDYSSSGNHTIEVSVSDGIDEAKMQHSIYISECHPRYDVNEDGVVNILDITNVSREYETTVSKPYPRYDTNQDGEINILDLTLVGHHFGEKVE